MSLLPLSLLFFVTVFAGEGCRHHGKLYNDGQSRQDEQNCNSCKCTLNDDEGKWKCGQKNCTGPVKPSGGCIDRDIFYNHKEQRLEECNTCSCYVGRSGTGHWSCTQMSCMGH